MTPFVWRAYLGAGALAACAVLALPAGPKAVLYNAVSASAALAVALGALRYRPSGVGAWWLVAAGQGLFVLGDVLFTVNELVLHIEPFPSLADVLYLAGYPAFAGGLALLLRRRSTRRDRPALLDAAIIATGFGLITWVLVMVPYSMVGLSEPAPERRARVSRGRLLAMGAAALVAPALLVVERLQGDRVETAAISAGWTLLFVLVGARMVGLVRDIERAEQDRRRLFDRTLQATEQERIEVAAELHDGPIQRLTALTYELEHAKQRLLRANPEEGAARLGQAQTALSAEVQGLRQLMVSLRPPALDEVGLEAALRDQVSAFARRSGVDCSLRVALDGRLDRELETVLYRITQEALHNVARHAGAGRLWLDLEEAGGQVSLEIRDDGVGFKPVSSSALVRAGRFGLAGMRERVEMAGGSWQVDARPGGGVTIRASFQVPSAA